MTSKKRLLAVLAVLSVGMAVFAGTIVAVAAAQSTEESEGRSLVERVANILGIETETVQDAFDQASQEIAAEKREAHIDGLVEKGLITEEEAVELRDWWSEAPDISPLRPGFKGGFGFFGHRQFGKFGLGLHGDGYSEWLDALVEKEMITQEEADELEAWLSEAPDVSLYEEKEERSEGHRGRFGKRYESFGEMPFGGYRPGIVPGDYSEWLDGLVEKGLMTQEDADELEALLDGFKDSFEEGMPGQHSFDFDSDDGRFRFRGHWGWHGKGDGDSSSEGSESTEDGEASDTNISYGNPI